MSYKFNPFTGTLDEVGAGGGAATPGGADTQVQFNDGGALGGDAGLAYDKTTDKLTVGGDIDLGTVGTFSTTLQTVTPTANRTVSIPDATGTIGLVNGPTGSIQFNQAGALNGTSDFSTTLNWNSATTTFTGLKLNVTDTASAADSNLLDLQVDGVSQFRIVPNDPGSVGGGSSLGILSRRLNIQNYYGSTFISNGSGASNGLKIGQNTSGFLDITASDVGVNFSLANGATKLTTDAADIFAQRNGTNAQTYRLYNTYTNASNYQRTSINDDSTGLIINQEYAGTGAVRTNLLDLQVGGTSKAQINSAGGGEFSSSVRGYNLYATLGSAQNYAGVFGSGGGRLIAASGGLIGFTNSATSVTASVDVGIARDSAGVVKVTDGSTGTGYLKLIPTTVGALTAAATVGAGTKAFVTDSTSTLSAHHGQTVVGGGSNFVPVFSDGTNWIVG